MPFNRLFKTKRHSLKGIGTCGALILIMAMPGVSSAQEIFHGKSSQAAAKNTEFSVSSVSVVLASPKIKDGEKTLENLDSLSVLYEFIGKKLNVFQIYDLANKLTIQSRASGYVVSRFVVTDDDLTLLETTGELRFSFYPGKVGRISIKNGSNVNTEKVFGVLADAMCEGLDEAPLCAGGQILTATVMERATLNLQDVPGILPGRLTLGASSVGEGETHLGVEVDSSGPSGILSFAVDNYGIAATGRNRFGFLGNYTNALGLGDVVQLSVVAAEKDLYNGSINFSSPVGNSGLRAVAELSRLTYSVNSAVSKGVGDSIYIGFNYPIVRALRSNVRAQVDLNYTEGKAEKNKAVISDSALTSIRFSISGDRTKENSPGFYKWSFGGTSGQVDIEDRMERSLDRGGARKYGGYNKYTFGYLRRENLFGDALGPYSQINIRGQLSDKNLDGSEKLALGGPSYVRAYAPDEVSVDEGVIASLDLRYPFYVDGYQISPGVFYDYAEGKLNRKPWQPNAHNRISRQGYGISLDMLFSKNASIGLMAAERTEPGRTNDRYQFWFIGGFKF